MTDFLLFTLYAPLASWGEIAVGETRGSWDRPSRSAVLGILAAALGIRREEQARHEMLDAGYGIAVRLDAPGATMADYHTAQTVAASIVRRRRPATRAALLNAVAPGDRQTILSRRTYRQDALATVAIWRRAASPPHSLEELRHALSQPRFVLYAGRKANALGLPLAAEVLPATTLGDALLRYAEWRRALPGAPAGARAAVSSVFDRLAPRDVGTRRVAWGREVSHDPCTDFDSGLDQHRREVRRDAAPHRGRWQFAERIVEVGLLPEPEAEVHRSAPPAEPWEADI
ncbi:MAG TPA: type I-E CRISPR-associated protein Cas5/CasD [Gemmatimonadaceae bacterium]|nr:type I-E CRISPR-associated protein Cas5/CasD [Gemmatimonadaceae bacterium]